MRVLILALLLGAAGAVFAQSEAYQASVSVPDQLPASRDAALREALAQVVGRVSGEGSLPQAASIIGRAPQLVQRYGFERDEMHGLRLTAAFDPKAVDAALKAQGLAVWGVFAGPVEEVGVSVSGIRSGADYARVLNAMRGMPGVKSVRVLAASGDHVSLSVRAEGGSGRLAGAASIGSSLVRDNSGNGLAFTLTQ